MKCYRLSKEDAEKLAYKIDCAVNVAFARYVVIKRHAGESPFCRFLPDEHVQYAKEAARQAVLVYFQDLEEEW
jgi:hypothetical protein